MLAFRSLASPVPASRFAANSFTALYSTVSGLARRNWDVSGPAPTSFLETEETEERVRDLSKLSRSARLRRQTPEEPTPHEFKAHSKTMKKHFPEGWSPPRKLSREAMDGLRSLHAHDPEIFSTPLLAEKFKISPEAVRRILRSKWTPSPEQRQKMILRERKAREEWIMAQRMAERRKQLELERKISVKRAKDELSLW
ncbi:uncharacterized protein PHACADRAFT_252029 [Phanerochaete carnosa HHB-10118-sp]|uniref:Required for respiratory growth protein 9, mitochondrial n=1 Tax=Phanerochaete carnosa (strain HHB-10118-sp) TaxID=650164 RepID=K5W2G2_PHACS|nr:uncharacterized protein PHACADRAFT_252029 [Phanerochaete carnosa HHB-10118-sp]EKM58053.1 hypothetical protein PHACADRAFT_252029 [Phanerochaete carnosa HHB-10118-sp]